MVLDCTVLTSVRPGLSFTGLQVLIYSVGYRLSMLLDEEFSLIEGNLEKLQATLPGADVVSLVEQQPLFLFEDMEVILAELRR